MLIIVDTFWPPVRVRAGAALATGFMPVCSEWPRQLNGCFRAECKHVCADRKVIYIAVRTLLCLGRRGGA